MDQRTLGIACVVGAVTIFVLQDALIKWLSGDYPLHEIVLVRAVSAICVTLFVMRLEGGIHLLRTRRFGLHLARAGLLVIANSAFFLALAAMTIAEATSIFFVAPLLITALSALMLRDAVGPRRWTAVCIGLVGVIVMLRPGEGALRLVAVLPIVAACAYALMQIITRRLGTTERASTIAFYAQAGFIAVSVAFGLVAGHGRFAPEDDASLAFLLRAWTVPYDPGRRAVPRHRRVQRDRRLPDVAGIPHLQAIGHRAVRVRGAADGGDVGRGVLRQLAGHGHLCRNGADLRQRSLRAASRDGRRTGTPGRGPGRRVTRDGWRCGSCTPSPSVARGRTIGFPRKREPNGLSMTGRG